MAIETTRVGGISVDASGGEGRPILFIHGNSSSAATFSGQLEGPLGSAYRCLAMSLPGHGASDSLATADDYSLPAYTAAVADVVKALTDAPPLLVGWSLGGHIALEALTVVPAIAGVCIYGTPPLGNPPDMEASFLPNPAMGVGFSDAVNEEDARSYATSFMRPESETPIDACVADILATDGNARIGLGACVGAGNYSDEMEIVSSMTQPLAILHGVGEQLVAREYFERLDASRLWRGQVHDIEGAGHAPHLETPEAFDALLASFASEV